MPAAGTPVWTVEPFRMGTAEEFARVREVFTRHGFEEARLCERVEASSIHEFPTADGRTEFRDAADPLSALVLLFLDGAPVAWEALRQAMPAEDLAAIESLGMLHSLPGDAGRCVASVSIYPLEGIHVASDRREGFDSDTGVPPADLVYSPITQEAERFLRLMPRDRGMEVLDLCSGSGVGALIAATRSARSVTAVDITERSTRFARFNAALNGLANVEPLQGNVYEPVGDRTFDVITAHPPYVPAFETEYVFRDGGEDGEQVTRAIIEGLATHLRPGGQFFCDCMMSEREDQTLEERIRAMLGEAAGEFDVVVGQGRSMDPMYFFVDRARAGRASFAQVERWHQVVEGGRIEEMIFTSILLQRRVSERPVITTRRALSPLTSGADLQWVLRWMVETAGWHGDDWKRLLGARPRTSSRTELRSRSALEDGQWAIEECILVTLAPFAVEASCPTWYATLLQWCDGRMTAREHLQYLRDTHAVPDDAPEEAFAMMMRQLVDAGLVEVEEFRLPDATAMRDSASDVERAPELRVVERAD